MPLVLISKRIKVFRCCFLCVCFSYIDLASIDVWYFPSNPLLYTVDFLFSGNQMSTAMKKTGSLINNAPTEIRVRGLTVVSTLISLQVSIVALKLIVV